MKRLDRIIIAVAYVLLVGVLVVGGNWLQTQLDNGDHDRCLMMQAQVDLIVLGIGVISDNKPSEASLHLIDKVQTELKEVCKE